MSKPIIPMASSVAEGRCHALWSCHLLGPIGCRALKSTTDAARRPFPAAQAFRHTRPPEHREDGVVSTKRLWLISGAAVAAVAILVFVASFFAPQVSEAEPTPTPTAAASTSPSPLPSPTPTTTPSPTASPTPTATTCDDIATAAFQQQMTGNGWVSWQTQDQATGARPFDAFPNGSPRGTIVCRWGADPAAATDDVIDIGWTPIDPENAVAAMQKLTEQGYVRTDTPEFIYLSLTGPAGYTDAAGWGETYAFGLDDVRWAATRADVDQFVKAPSP